jgi:hypothetical protein
MGFYPVAVVQSYSTTVRQTRTRYTITQNNTHTQHEIHRTMKDQIQQCSACENNEDTLLPMNTMRKYSFQPHYGPRVDPASNRNEYQEFS